MGYWGDNQCQHLASIRALQHHCGRRAPPDIIPNSIFYPQIHCLSTQVNADATDTASLFALFYVIIGTTSLIALVLSYYTRWSVMEVLRTEALRWPNPTVQVATQTWWVPTFWALYRQIFHTEVFRVTTLARPPSTWLVE